VVVYFQNLNAKNTYTGQAMLGCKTARAGRELVGPLWALRHQHRLRNSEKLLEVR